MKRHLVPLGESGWSLWRWVCLRGAGFSAAGTRLLGSDELERALEAEGVAESRVREARRDAIDADRIAGLVAARAAARAAKDFTRGDEIRNELAGMGVELLDTPQGTDWRVHDDASWTAIAGAQDAGPLSDAGMRLREARAANERARAAADEMLVVQRGRNAEVLLSVARDPRFREALTWQNRVVVRSAVEPILRAAPGVDDADSRRERRTVARYFQRYALKNDTIGFFGPTGWGTVDPGTAGLIATPGSTLLDKRVVFFEDWAVAAVAARLSEDPDVREIFTPRRRPSSWLDGTTLYAPPAKPRQLTVVEAWLVGRVDGERSVRELTAAAAADPTSGLGSAEAAARELARLGSENVITWGLEVPAELEHPERWLRERLGRIVDPEARARALAPLDRLDAARAEVARAAGDPDALDRTIAMLESEFQAITERSAKRSHGQTYAGRQIFFEDCRRAIDLRIGRAVLDELDGPLGLILQSARWYTYEIGRRFRAGFDEAYERALAQQPGRPLPLTSFLSATRGLLSPDRYETCAIVAAVQRELQRRWSEIFGLDRADLSARSLVLRTDACRARVHELFAAPCPGWPLARYHSPDVMIAAASVEHVQRGEFLAVLGEIHAGVNTLMTHTHLSMHPDPGVLEEAYDVDMDRVCIAPIQSGTNRTMNSSLSARDLHVEFGTVRSWRPRGQVHLAGDLYVDKVGDRLRVRARTGDLDFDIMAFMDPHVGSQSISHFKLFSKVSHVPRITVDKLVVSRERWHLERSAFSALVENVSEVDPVRRVASWARRLGLPRYLFATVPHEPKPFYVDLASPIFIDLFVRYLDQATSLGLSEMLPSHDELWLADADGTRYTSELRFAVVDPVAWDEA